MNEPKLIDRNDIRNLVRQKYGEAALQVSSRGEAACCGSGADLCCGETTSDGCCTNVHDPITSDLYSDLEADMVPETAILASLGCGNPTALAELREGEVVLDLGSGGGIDVLLSAKRVGARGFAYGLDMTDEMLALAETNRVESGATNVEFLRGHIEEIPLPDASIDVIISNCVINLAADKAPVLREAFRVLRPGGRFAVSDVVIDGPLPEAIQKDMELYVGCVAGALEISEYERLLRQVGFESISLETTRRYQFSNLETSWSSEGIGKLTESERRALDGKIMSAFIRAVKPA